MFKYKNILKKILKLGNLSSEEYIKILRSRGTDVGEGTVFYEPKSVRIDGGYPYCVKIGKNVQVTTGVIILAHDYSYSVLNEVYGVMPQNSYNTVIGDNVFIGQRAIILPGTIIGNNVIIGAGAVVHGKIPNNSVCAGNPAKVICSLEEFKDKREKNFEAGAVLLAKTIIEKYGRKPTITEMRMYIGLFLPRTDANRHFFEELPTNTESEKQNIWNSQQKYDNFDDFLEKNRLI